MMWLHVGRLRKQRICFLLPLSSNVKRCAAYSLQLWQGCGCGLYTSHQAALNKWQHAERIHTGQCSDQYNPGRLPRRWCLLSPAENQTGLLLFTDMLVLNITAPCKQSYLQSFQTVWKDIDNKNKTRAFINTRLRVQSQIFTYMHDRMH